MNLELRREQELLIAQIHGELDLKTSPLFRQLIEEELRKSPQVKHLILDFQKTVFIDSSGLGAILGRYKTLTGRAGKLSGINVPRHLQKLLELSGLLKIMTIYPSLQEVQNKF